MMRDRFSRLGGFTGLPGLFKIFVLFGTVAIAAIFVIYTNFLIGQLQDNVKRDVRMWAKLWELAGAEDSSPRLNAVIFEEIIQKAYFPIIVTDTDKNPVLWARVRGVADSDTSRIAYEKIRSLAVQLEEENGATPVSWNNQVIQYILFDYPPLVEQLQIMPIIQIAVVAVFLIVGALGFRNIQRSEQNNIWVGMAKETAHQLGTPISSLLGWLEVVEQDVKDGCLVSKEGCSESIGEITRRMRGDVSRLDKVAMRFGQIGSPPATSRQDINILISETVEYFRLRLPHRGKGVRINHHPGEDIYAEVNPELFGWVLENLIKNSLQASDAVTGVIDVETARSSDGENVEVRITDNGVGISPQTAKKVFQTGFSTKKRGWGIGLTLAKRIIADYHNGRIELRESVPHLRTTFEITLPYASAEEENRG